MRRKGNKGLPPPAAVDLPSAKENPAAGDGGHALSEASSLTDPERGSLAARLVPRDKRPTHRLKLGFMPFALPFIGKKVDSIEWAREEIRVCSELLDKGREVIEAEDVSEPTDGKVRDGSKAEGEGHRAQPRYPAFNSAFVTFRQQIAAHLALQALAHHEPYSMSGRWAEMSPQEVIWGNLGLDAYQQKVSLPC